MDNKDDLKDGKKLISNIKMQYMKLSKGQKLIAKYILDNYDKVAFMTAAKLSEEVGVSESTVVRFANALGYSGYPKLQDALEELIKNKLTTVQRVDMIDESKTDSEILHSVLKGDITNIKNTIESIDENVFKEACEKLIKAKKVYILGMRSSFAIAQYLGFYLDMILDNVQIIRVDMADIFDQIVRIDKDDVLFVISFPRYSQKAYQTAVYAKERQSYIISLTDSIYSPVASLADNVLLVKNNMTSFVDSLVPAFSVVNALIILISKKEKEKIRNHLMDLENMWDKFSVYK